MARLRRRNPSRDPADGDLGLETGRQTEKAIDSLLVTMRAGNSPFGLDGPRIARTDAADPHERVEARYAAAADRSRIEQQP